VVAEANFVTGYLVRLAVTLINLFAETKLRFLEKNVNVRVVGLYATGSVAIPTLTLSYQPSYKISPQKSVVSAG
jgi:hypothetical protein